MAITRTIDEADRPAAEADRREAYEAGRPAREPDRPIEETVRLGEAIYEREIRAQVEADHMNEYVAIDVDSGCWAVAACEMEASRLLRLKQPDAYDEFMMWVGHPTLRYVGGESLLGLAGAE